MKHIDYIIMNNQLDYAKQGYKGSFKLLKTVNSLLSNPDAVIQLHLTQLTYEEQIDWLYTNLTVDQIYELHDKFFMYGYMGIVNNLNDSIEAFKKLK